jgi:hypothetical protein
MFKLDVTSYELKLLHFQEVLYGVNHAVYLRGRFDFYGLLQFGKTQRAQRPLLVFWTVDSAFY